MDNVVAHSPARRKPIAAGQKLIALPPVPLAKRLFETQFAYFGSTFCLTDRAQFEEDLRRIHTEQLDLNFQDDCLDYCQVLIILAFGQMYSINQWTNDQGPPGYAYFQQAMELLPEIHGQGSLTFVKVLALTAWFLQNLNRRDAAFLYIGLAIRMSVTLGLHQEVSDRLYDAATREHRRRLWWSIYSMDRILCIKFGNPPMISDEDINVLPPSSLEGESDEDGPAVALRHYTELSKLLGKILKALYRRGQSPKANLITSVQSILADLSSWDANLPQRLRFKFDSNDQSISREVVSIYLHYSQCINMAARPLVFQVVRKRLQGQKDADTDDWMTGLLPAAVSIVNACVAAARNTVFVMARAAHQNWIATYGYQDAEHAFSAALILVMVNIALPFRADDHKAMCTALEIMQGMADKGSDHVRYLHNLLLNLCTAMGLRQPNESSTDTSTQIQGPEIPSPARDLAALLPQFDLSNEVGEFQGDEDMMRDLDVTNDPNFWWDGYGILEMNRI
ncbi:unnamed protein product [Clonostachys chloroleuca]|uniref:Xylanolytic transcriptional activator regulatory domain-containing protein n=1 Tax=Clonostachys chloroleuca TaxID=1926264 RepID=A0AA35LU59_9HYPO|nr:unnamed protein product [Clonostachys chloroleuca]